MPSAVARLFKTLFRKNRCDCAHGLTNRRHDWAARDPQTDFTVNANGTPESARSGETIFSRSAVYFYVDKQSLRRHAELSCHLQELPTRWEIEPGHEYEPGISETMSIDYSEAFALRRIKAAADILVQEYGRYFANADRFFSWWVPYRTSHASAGAARFFFLI